MTLGVIAVVLGVAIGASIIVQLLLQYLVRRTKLGKSMRAASFDKPTARLMGINTNRIYLTTFGIGSACVGSFNLSVP